MLAKLYLLVMCIAAPFALLYAIEALIERLRSARRSLCPASSDLFRDSPTLRSVWASRTALR
jgi:hypothetical protein